MSVKIKNIVLVTMTALFLFGFSIWGILAPDGTESKSERRPLAAFPELNAESVMSGKFMTDFEKYTLDQFPMRDRFRTVKSVVAFYVFGNMDNNDIYIKNGYAAKLEYPMNDESVDYALDRFRFVYDKLLADSGCHVYLSVIPDKNFFMAKENGYPSFDYGEFMGKMKDGMEYAEYIDITDLLELSDYYRTDTHWRQEKITDVARRISEKMGVAITAEYAEKRVEIPFYGVYYGQSALPLKADELYYLDGDVFSSCKVYDYETDSYIPVYDLEKTTGNDPYEMFLSGSKSLLVIENEKASTDKELIVFRDSFGSSLTPLFAEGYSKITVIDIRYISPSMLGNFVSFDNADVLFLYSTSVLNNSVTIK